MKAQRRTLITLVSVAGLAALLASLTGCDKDSPYGIAFNMNLHVEEHEIACIDCHVPVKGKGYKPIDHDICAQCHDDVIEADEITPKTCGFCHKLKNLDELGEGEGRPARSTRGVFIHTAVHDTMCKDCHAEIVGDKRSCLPELKRDQIMRIRDRAHERGMPCADCHVNMDPDVAPASHDHAWTKRHGIHASEENVACTVCHKEETCRECHQTTMPSSHNNLWRLKTHGIQANWDRQRCQTCHEEDFCSSCHAEVRPRSHNASWGRRHCTQCHSSASEGTGCATCHEGSLEAHPNPHSAGWRNRHCNSCHVGSPQEEQCRACHPGSIETHPNPHSAGWRNRHCNSCHVGSPQEEQCRICHPGSIETHPNPHSAGWRRRHCDNCHPGTDQERECRICHEGSIETHSNPHSAGWLNRHCFNCHPGSQAAEECAICHEGGSSVLVHQGSWPPVHDRFGDQADCYFCHTP